MTTGQVTELLAPAGDWECLRAAVANGADAVYFGLQTFNARHRATNFSVDELPAVMEFLHTQHVRGYVTLNTLVFSAELAAAAKLLMAASAAGADAVIVQDLGILRLARELTPDLPVHASTQTTQTEPLGIELWASLGAQRVILARELSLEEIAGVRQAVELPVEVFVHGALCVAYSGQCLTSEALGGRSANRGQCAQACRLPYELVVDGQTRDLGDKAYLLSPQDLAAHDVIDELVRLGVASLKIEGRLKSAEYVAVTTRTYRRALDEALGGRSLTLERQERQDLELSFSRGFGSGFLRGVNHQQLVSGRFPKSRGLLLGHVVEVTQQGLQIELDRARTTELTPPSESAGWEPAVASLVKPGDGIVIDEGHPEQDEQGGRVYGVRLVPSGPAPVVQGTAAQPGGRGDRGVPHVELRFGRGQMNLAAVSLGALVWKTDDPTLRRRLGRDFSLGAPSHGQPLTMELSGRVGGALTLTATCGETASATATWPGPLAAAEKHPLTAETARDQLGRLGDTPYELAAVRVTVDGPVMVPRSVLNGLRRDVIAQLQTARQQPAPRRVLPERLETLRQAAQVRCQTSASENASENGRQARAKAGEVWGASGRLAVMVRNEAQLAAVCEWQPPDGLPRPGLVYCDFEELRRQRPAVVRAREAGLPVALATLRVLKPQDLGLTRQILSAEPDALLVRNLGSLVLARREAPSLPLIGDYSLNVANELTAATLLEAGLSRLTPSYDLNWEQLSALLARGVAECAEVVVHQHLPMFHMEHCVFAHTLSEGRDYRDCGRPCDRHQVSLRDRTGALLPLAADTGCRNTVFNAVAQSAGEYVPRLLSTGVQWLRVELLRHSAAETASLLEAYARLLAGWDTGRDTWRKLRSLNQLGVTRGTLHVLG